MGTMELESRLVTRWYSSHAHGSGSIRCWLMPVTPTHLAESQYGDDLNLCVHLVSQHLAWHAAQWMRPSTLQVMFKMCHILMTQIPIHQLEYEAD